HYGLVPQWRCRWRPSLVLREGDPAAGIGHDFMGIACADGVPVHHRAGRSWVPGRLSWSFSQ
ncbi:MAG: hypothetical protein NTW87_22530, partial [Planctomycetota bacterium]|nr:hypothetical protein [Planctomycetota bacterium]